MRLSTSSGSACLGMSTNTWSTGIAIDHLKTIGSHFLIWAMFMTCSKYGRMKVLHVSMVQDAREFFFESITIGFQPERFEICITSDRE